MATVTLRANMGPDSLVEDIAGLIGDVGVACRFASSLQRIVDRNEAIYAVMRGRPDFLPDPEDLLLWRFGRSATFGWQGGAGVPVPSVERAIRAELLRTEADSRAEIRVQALTYSNPLEMVLGVSGLVVIAVLNVIRDWPMRRRLNEAVVADYESAVRARDEIRRHLVERVVSDGIRITPDQMTELLTPDVERALLALGDAPLDLEGLESGQD